LHWFTTRLVMTEFRDNGIAKSSYSVNFRRVCSYFADRSLLFLLPGLELVSGDVVWGIGIGDPTRFFIQPLFIYYHLHISSHTK
jgi:hypothetical protein